MMRKLVILVLLVAGCGPVPPPQTNTQRYFPNYNQQIIADRSTNSCASYEDDVNLWNYCMSEARRFHDPYAPHGPVYPYDRYSTYGGQHDPRHIPMMLRYLGRH